MGGVGIRRHFENMEKLSKYLIFCLILISIISLIAFDYFAKPQSDDWGFIVFLEKYGFWGSYQNMRSTFQTSPYMLFVMFPMVWLQKYIPYFILLFIVQVTLPISIFFLLRNMGFISKSVSIGEKALQFGKVFLFVILTYLTAWNTNTFQNAIFWLTGALGYILPITFFLLLLGLFMKKELNVIEKITQYVLLFLLVGVQINYVVLFAFILLFIFILKKITLDRVLFVFTLITLMYTWYYPGWLNRIPSENHMTIGKSLISFASLLKRPIISEPYWIVSLFIFILYVYNNRIMVTPKNIFLKFNFINNRLILMVLGLLLLSNMMILIAFNGELGYGRVFFISHFISVLMLFILVIPFYSLIEKTRLNGKVINILSSILMLVCFLIPLKSKIYESKRFSTKWLERDQIINAEIQNSKIACIHLQKLPKSGILGYVDLNDIVSCGDFIGFSGNLEYKKIQNYDNWVHQAHYKTNKSICIKK